MLASLRNLIKFVRFSKVEVDDKQFPVQQVEYMGKVVDVMNITPYGMHANIPVDFLGVMLQIGAQEQGRIVLPLSAKERIKGIESGEVIFFHPVTKSFIHFKNNKDIDIFTETDVNLNCKDANVTATGDINATATGDINATATGDINANGNNVSSIATTLATVTAPNIALNGIVKIVGSFFVNGKDIGENHGHTQANDSGGNTEQNTGGVV